MFDLTRITLFCLGYHLSKHKMIIRSKHLEGEWPPGYACGSGGLRSNTVQLFCCYD